MDAIAEKLSQWFGSTPFILLHIAWVAIWEVTSLGRELLVYIWTIEGLILVLFVLRAENIQGKRMEDSVKRAEKDTKEDLRKSDTIIEMLKRKGKNENSS